MPALPCRCVICNASLERSLRGRLSSNVWPHESPHSAQYSAAHVWFRVLNPRAFIGLSLSSRSAALHCACVKFLEQVFFGMYCLTSALLNCTSVGQLSQLQPPAAALRARLVLYPIDGRRADAHLHELAWPVSDLIRTPLSPDHAVYPIRGRSISV